MKILRDFDNYRKIFNYDLKKEIIEGDEKFELKTCGEFKYLNKDFTALYVKENNLFFVFKDLEFKITDDYNVIIEDTNVTEFKKLSLLKDNNCMINFEYFTEEFLNCSPFEYIDEEDFNWGMFISKIINNKERKYSYIKVIMENLSGVGPSMAVFFLAQSSIFLIQSIVTASGLCGQL